MTGGPAVGAEPPAGETGESALVVIRAGGPGQPLVCVHGEAGDLRLFHNLARHLDPARTVYGLQAVVRDLPPHAPYRRFEDMVERYVGELSELGQAGPYVVLGECNGGELAYELAQRLDASGNEVAMLVLVDSFGPGEPATVVNRLVFRLAHAVRMLAFHLSAVARMQPRERRPYVTARLGRIVSRVRMSASSRNGSPPPELLRQWAFREASEAYRPAPYGGRVVLFRGASLPWGARTSRDLGWGRLVVELEIDELDAYFGTCLLEPVVGRLAPAIERAAACSTPVA